MTLELADLRNVIGYYEDRDTRLPVVVIDEEGFVHEVLSLTFSEEDQRYVISTEFPQEEEASHEESSIGSDLRAYQVR